MRRLIYYMMESNRWKHFVAGFFLGLISVIISILAGILKEEHDEEHGWKYDYIDIAFTALGGFVGNVIQLIIIYLFYDGLQ